MRKSLLFATAALGLGGFAGAPAMAANSGPANAADQLISGSTKAVQDLKADHHYDHLLREAKGLFIVPTMVKGAVGIGGNGGQGVLLKRTSNGWSEPAFLTIGTLSLGPQAGGAAGQTVMLLMTNKALNDFTQANNFSVGANAGLTIVNYSAKGQAPAGKGDIIIWSNKSGAFAGASVSATDISMNKQEDKNFYHKPVTNEQILNGDVSQQAAAKPLLSELPT